MPTTTPAGASGALADGQRAAPPTFRARALGHVRLARLPLAATTVTDVWAGYFGARALGMETAPVEFGTLALIHGASLCFYVAGMTLNDAIDRERDRALHPERPIPSGAVSARAAFAQAAAVLAAGLAFGAAAGPAHGWAALYLAGAILAYDLVLKRWAVPGALAMGGARYLDVQLGAGLAGGAAFLPALTIGGYVAILTFISTLEERIEARGANDRVLSGAVALACLYLISTGYLYEHWLFAVWPFGVAAGLVAGFGRNAVREATRAAVGRLVLVMLLGIFFVNAGTLAGLGHPLLGLAAAALCASFFALRRLLGASPARPQTAGATNRRLARAASSGDAAP